MQLADTFVMVIGIQMVIVAAFPVIADQWVGLAEGTQFEQLVNYFGPLVLLVGLGSSTLLFRYFGSVTVERMQSRLYWLLSQFETPNSVPRGNVLTAIAKRQNTLSQFFVIGESGMTLVLFIGLLSVFSPMLSLIVSCACSALGVGQFLYRKRIAQHLKRTRAVDSKLRKRARARDDFPKLILENKNRLMQLRLSQRRLVSVFFGAGMLGLGVAIAVNSPTNLALSTALVLVVSLRKVFGSGQALVRSWVKIDAG